MNIVNFKKPQFSRVSDHFGEGGAAGIIILPQAPEFYDEFQG